MQVRVAVVAQILFPSYTPGAPQDKQRATYSAASTKRSHLPDTPIILEADFTHRHAPQTHMHSILADHCDEPADICTMTSIITSCHHKRDAEGIETRHHHIALHRIASHRIALSFRLDKAVSNIASTLTDRIA
ncbi:hypothetical protein DOTSEDRAFT_37507 [Dothistroma septosporum NZE10]|uniref:Uncharacterized protein n=1 Tax=Dothistroma septosporum (strain NZE10 / CBS 128990) TaxID=675120 RepID=N1PGU5_DOTSN|nr:hypothetical protein DOTSEDRAFT_37507 [Dothistroma septosporum NZE10]